PCPPPGSSQRNPTGGSPPYHFQYGTMGGFPPFGVALGKDGQLTGTPHPATGGKAYRFTVCAVDLKGDFVCREVSLTVTGAAQPPPVVQPPPAPAPQPAPADTTPLSVSITSTSCPVVRDSSTSVNVVKFEPTVSGRATGPVGTSLMIAVQYSGSTGRGDFNRFRDTASWTSGTRARQEEPASTSWTFRGVVFRDIERTPFVVTLRAFTKVGDQQSQEVSTSFTCQR
ncbi:MAG: hypothetical protein AAB289_07215, partial [Chloroflexota bacterium]